ncbi:ROK family protein [Chloroflexota bacterium]
MSNSRLGKKHELPVLAIDLGGTKILAAIISDDGRMIAKERFPTLADEEPKEVINRLFSAIDQVLNMSNMDPSQLDSIGIAAAGGIDLGRGLITQSPNLPGWKDIPLRDMVQEKCRVKTFLVNDASAAALGEHRFGTGRGIHNLIMLTLGTGIGGGIVINGQLYCGATGSAGEIGHMTIDVNGPECACGNRGCLEAFASGTAVAREAIRRIKHGEKSSLVKVVDGKIEDITAEKVGVAARAGDPLSLDVITKAATYLGVGMVSLVNIFNPEMIIAGGGMAEMGDLLLGPAGNMVKERAFPMAAQSVQIVTAHLGNEAGAYGAAAFAFEQEI